MIRRYVWSPYASDHPFSQVKEWFGSGDHITTQPRKMLPLHPVEVSEEGYAMIKEPWRITKFGHGYGICCDDQQFPTKCEHQRDQDAYAYLRVEPEKGSTHDVYGYELPPRLTPQRE